MSKLFQKLAAILGEVGTIPKSGYNSFHKYDYVTENDLVNLVRDKLSKAGIFVFTSVDQQDTVEVEGGKIITVVKTTHTFADSETGETFEVHSAGAGEDKGDKGVYKAITGAMKYMIYKNFMVPTGDDPENEPKGKKSTSVRNRTKRSGKRSRKR